MRPPLRCPACRFMVFNRRVPRCEKCGVDLPPEFRYSAADLALIAAEEARVERMRKDLQHDRDEAQRKRQRRWGDGG